MRLSIYSKRSNSYYVVSNWDYITLEDVRIAIEDALADKQSQIELRDDSELACYCRVRPTVKGIVKLLRQIQLNK